MQEQKTPNKNWKKYILIGSVGLNLIFAGLVVGAALKNGPKHRDAVNMGNMRAVMKALPEEKRTELRSRFEQNKEKNKFDRAQFRQAAKNVSTAIEAVPFDRTALQSALDQQHMVITLAAQSSRDAFVDLISNMSDDERAGFAKNMREHHQKQKPKK